jgi:hypothetical protein
MKREDQSKESKLSQTLSNVLHDEKVPEEPKVDKQKKKDESKAPEANEGEDATSLNQRTVEQASARCRFRSSRGVR